MARTPKPWWRSQTQEYCVHIDGKLHRLGPDKDQADTEFHLLMAKEKARTVPRRSVQAVIELFLQWSEEENARETFLWYKKHLQSFKDGLKPPLLAVTDLKAEHVEKWIKSHGWQGSYKRGAITAVSRCFNWAFQQDIIERNPIYKKLKKPKSPKREVYITAAKYREIVKHIDGNFKDLVIVAWESGCRPQEITKVEARHVDLKGNRWVFSEDESKGKQDKRVVYLSKKAMVIVKRLMKKNPRGPLFLNGEIPWTRFEVSHAFGRLEKHVGFRYRLYDLRFSFCTNGLTNGVDPITMQHLMGHKDLQMISKIYALVSQDASHMQRAAMKATSG